MTSRRGLISYVAAFDPTGEAIGPAEFEARLSALLGVGLDDLDETIRTLPAARLARVLHADDPGARGLRERLWIVSEAASAQAAATAQARALDEPARPANLLFETLLAIADRAPLTPEERLEAEIRAAREEIVALWPKAFDAVARWGVVDQRAAWSIGVGSVVYGMICQVLERSTDEPITREEFVAVCPRLVEFWPMTAEAHRSMHALLAVVRAAADGKVAAPRDALEALS
jgi:hypothetical protein